MRSQRFLFIRLLRGVACIVGALVVFLTALFLILQLESVQRYILQHAVQRIDPTLRLELQGTRGLFPGRVKIDTLTVARVQPDGTSETCLTVDHFSLKWHPWALINRVLEVEALTAQTVTVLGSDAPDATPTSFQDMHPLVLFEKISGQRLPVAIEWHTLEIGRLELPEWSAISVSSEGQVARDFHVNATLDVAPLAADSPEGYLQCTLSPDAELTLDADLKLPPNAALAETLHFPTLSPVHLHLEGTGKIQDWTGILRVDAGTRGALMGRFRGDLATLSVFKLTGAGKIGAWPEAQRWIGPEVTFHIAGTHPNASEWTFEETRIRARDFELYTHGQLTSDLLDLKLDLKVAELAPYGALFDMPLGGSLLFNLTLGGAPLTPAAAFSLEGARWTYGDTQVETIALQGTLQPEANSLSQAKLVMEGRVDGLIMASGEHALTQVPPQLTFTLKGLLDFLVPMFEWDLDLLGGAYRLKTAGVLTPETSSWQGKGTLTRQSAQSSKAAAPPEETLVQTTASGGWADEKKNSGPILK